MKVLRKRSALWRTRQRLESGALTVGFIGGSITDARPGWNWPEPVIAWLSESFPTVRLTIENAAIGATGSDLAVWRAERDLIERAYDLVFIEFAVNDLSSPSEQRQRAREGLVRKLLAGAGRDLVLTYAFSQPMYADMLAGRMPEAIAEFEQLTEHYDLSSVWMGLHALEEVRCGWLRWEDWLPDGLHPQQRGSLTYAHCVIALLEQELLAPTNANARPNSAHRPAPLNPSHWEDGYRLPFAQVQLEGPSSVRNWPKLSWIDYVLHTTAVGARVSSTFEGRGLVLGFDFGRASAEFGYQLDGGPTQFSERDRPNWCPLDGWYRLFHVADDLPPGRHTLTLEVMHGNPSGDFDRLAQYSGTNFDLALIGVLP
jgi:lysophospholipase L1-like esterase